MLIMHMTLMVLWLIFLVIGLVTGDVEFTLISAIIAAIAIIVSLNIGDGEKENVQEKQDTIEHANHPIE